ncbi:hypothetical protein LEMLEM_LOCUS2025, partial [Lemmus lemmus]
LSASLRGPFDSLSILSCTLQHHNTKPVSLLRSRTTSELQ